MTGTGTLRQTPGEGLCATLTSSSLTLLLFTVGGVAYAVDADQIARITAYDKEEHSDDVCWLHEEMGYGSRPVGYQVPTVVLIKAGSVGPYRVIIDRMEDIAECSYDDITLLPELVTPFLLQKGIWALLVRNGVMVFLLDFQRLLQTKKNMTDV